MRVHNDATYFIPDMDIYVFFFFLVASLTRILSVFFSTMKFLVKLMYSYYFAVFSFNDFCSSFYFLSAWFEFDYLFFQ